MSEEAGPDTRPRILVMPLLDALEYDAAVHLHRGQPPVPQIDVPQTEQGNGKVEKEQAKTTVEPPKVLPWRKYMQAQGKRMGTAGAGLGLLLLGSLVMMGGMLFIGNDVDLYLESLPRPISNAAPSSEGVPIGSDRLQPIGDLPSATHETSEEAATPGKPLPANWLSLCLLHLAFFPAVIFGFVRAANARIKKAEEAEVGVPLTSANMGHLPAAESLLRASEKLALPAQEALLRPAQLQALPEQMLRPAAYSEEKLPEQLVRPAGGQE